MVAFENANLLKHL